MIRKLTAINDNTSIGAIAAIGVAKTYPTGWYTLSV